MATLNLDLTTVEIAKNFDLIPAGDYPAGVVQASLKQSKSGSWMIEAEIEITEGDFEGRKLWDYFVLDNEIAKQRLKSMVVAAGLPEIIRDTDQLCGAEFIIKVKVENDDNYGAKNKIAAYKPLANKKPQTPTTTVSPKPANATVRPPWVKA